MLSLTLAYILLISSASKNSRSKLFTKYAPIQNNSEMAAVQRADDVSSVYFYIKKFTTRRLQVATNTLRKLFCLVL